MLEHFGVGLLFQLRYTVLVSFNMCVRMKYNILFYFSFISIVRTAWAGVKIFFSSCDISG